MYLVKLVETKAKWCLPVNAEELGMTGYFDGWSGRDTVFLAPGVNQILRGKLYLTGTERGRSAAHLCFRDDYTQEFTTTLTGAEALFTAVAKGDMLLTMTREGPCFNGDWTFAKRGTQYFILPTARC